MLQADVAPVRSRRCSCQTSSAFLPLSGTFPSRHWSGHPDPEYTVGAQVGILTCTCGEFLCGGIMATIDLHDWFVVWKQFSDMGGDPIPVRTHKFELPRYLEQIDKISPATR